MVSLLDIAPARETVEIGGKALEVGAISLDQIVTLMRRFGDVFELLSGDFSKAPATMRPLIGAVIAAACGELGNAKVEAHAAGFSIGDQAAILAAIRRVTMPRGVRPFLLDLSALGLPLNEVIAAFDEVAAEALASLSSSPVASAS